MNKLLLLFLAFICGSCSEQFGRNYSALLLSPDAGLPQCLIDISGDTIDGSVPVIFPYSYNQSLTDEHLTSLLSLVPEQDAGTKPFTATADLEDPNNYSEQGNIRISDVAEIAGLICNIHRIMELENNDKVCQLLSSGHFVVFDSFESYYELFNSYSNIAITELESNNEAFLFIKNFNAPDCWLFTNDSNWSIITQNKYFISDDISVIVHVMMHIVAYAMNNNPDTNHENHDLWHRYHAHTLAGRTIQAYEFKYNPGNCDSDR